MKTLASHISEALKIGKNICDFSKHSCQPKTREELKSIVYDRIDKEGPNCDLNDIDVSQIEDMSSLFYRSSFNGDISEWDVSKVKNMGFMFIGSSFNGDISNWDVRKVESMTRMFQYSPFNQDISNWNISKDCATDFMFLECPIKEEYKPKGIK